VAVCKVSHTSPNERRCNGNSAASHREHLPLLPLTVGGAVASAAGRVALARLANLAGDRLPDKDRKNALALATFMDKHPRWQDAIVVAYSLGPLPSNSLFIAAGLGRLRLRRVVLWFCVCRAISNTIWVSTVSVATRSMGDIFRNALTSPRSIATQIVSAVLVIAVVRLPWATWLERAVDAKEAQREHATEQAARSE
jgi:membrane protein DedA with SNARE-associated domain